MPVKWIAEIGSNHNQDLNRTISLIKKAKEIGANSVKFQLFKANYLYAPEFKNKISTFRKCELPEDFLCTIKEYCDYFDLELGISVFDLEAVKVASEFADWLKIGSYELLYTDLIKAVVKTKKPIVLSIGMAIDDEIYETIHLIAYHYQKKKKVLGYKYPLTILHCVSTYPASKDDCESVLANMKNRHNFIPADSDLFFNYNFGWSDHSVNNDIVKTAIDIGAKTIEFHFDLEDGKGFETKVGHCWLPSQIKPLIEKIDRLETESRNRYLSISKNETEAKKWRTDPEDGLRPLRKYREELLNESN